MNKYKKEIKDKKQRVTDLGVIYAKQKNKMYLRRLEHKENILIKKRNISSKQRRKYYQTLLDENRLLQSQERARQQWIDKDNARWDYEGRKAELSKLERQYKNRIIYAIILPIILFLSLGIALNVFSGKTDQEITSTPIDKTLELAKVFSESGDELKNNLQEIRVAYDNFRQQIEPKEPPKREDFDTYWQWNYKMNQYMWGWGDYRVNYSELAKTFIKTLWIFVKTPPTMIFKGIQAIF